MRSKRVISYGHDPNGRRGALMTKFDGLPEGDLLLSRPIYTGGVEWACETLTERLAEAGYGS